MVRLARAVPDLRSQSTAVSVRRHLFKVEIHDTSTRIFLATKLIYGSLKKKSRLQIAKLPSNMFRLISADRASHSASHWQFAVSSLAKEKRSLRSEVRSLQNQVQDRSCLGGNTQLSKMKRMIHCNGISHIRRSSNSRSKLNIIYSICMCVCIYIYIYDDR